MKVVKVTSYAGGESCFFMAKQRLLGRNTSDIEINVFSVCIFSPM